MTNEKLNTALYKKMFAEQEKYRNWILSQPPDEILKHTYEYTMRQDILISLEYHDLSDRQTYLQSGKTKKQTTWMIFGARLKAAQMR